MNRKEFIAGTGALLGAALAPATARAASPEDDDSIRQLVKDYYSTFYVLMDKRRYRSLLTDDYLLLEDGEILDAAGDLALMPPSDIGYKRTDSFAFHSVKIQGDAAWTVYTLKSDSTDTKKGARHAEFLESMVFRRTSGRWLVALLHSTKVTPVAK
jgi:ketosteroid isomerase-like protein